MRHGGVAIATLPHVRDNRPQSRRGSWLAPRQELRHLAPAGALGRPSGPGCDGPRVREPATTDHDRVAGFLSIVDSRMETQEYHPKEWALWVMTIGSN